MWQALYRIIMESSNNYTYQSQTSRIAERTARRAKEETSAVLLQSGSDDKWVSDSVEWYFLWQMVQQNYQEETANSKNPLWDGNLP